jgi:hypothetical protein
MGIKVKTENGQVTMSLRKHRCIKDGMPRTAGASGKFIFDVISDAGWIKITNIGQENIYFIFTDDEKIEREGYCKCL